MDLNAVLEKALAFTLAEEGGWSDHPNDKGGATKYGITVGVYRGVGRDHDGDGDVDAADLRLITKDEARSIYRNMYWPWDKFTTVLDLSEAVLIKVFDIGVNAGPKQAAKLFQRAVNRVLRDAIPEDGVLGTLTLHAAAACDQARLLATICEVQEEFYLAIVRKDPTQEVFLKGWTKRARRTP